MKHLPVLDFAGAGASSARSTGASDASKVVKTANHLRDAEILAEGGVRTSGPSAGGLSEPAESLAELRTEDKSATGWESLRGAEYFVASEDSPRRHGEHGESR